MMVAYAIVALVIAAFYLMGFLLIPTRRTFRTMVFEILTSIAVGLLWGFILVTICASLVIDIVKDSYLRKRE
jgi:hypothetical protein